MLAHDKNYQLNYYHKRLFDALLITKLHWRDFQAKRTWLKTIKCVDCGLTISPLLETFSWQLCPQILPLQYFLSFKVKAPTETHEIVRKENDTVWLCLLSLISTNQNTVQGIRVDKLSLTNLKFTQGLYNLGKREKRKGTFPKVEQISSQKVSRFCSFLQWGHVEGIQECKKNKYELKLENKMAKTSGSSGYWKDHLVV